MAGNYCLHAVQPTQVISDSTYDSTYNASFNYHKGSYDFLFGLNKCHKWTVLAPLLFTVYVAPIGCLIKTYGMDYKQYADDTTLYTIFSVGDTRSLINLSECTEAISLVPSQLNLARLKQCLLGSPSSCLNLDPSVLKLLEIDIQPSSNLKVHGVAFDNKLSMNNQVSIVCRSCNYHIRALQLISAALKETADMLACRILYTRLDYCNSLNTGMYELNYKRLQVVQNKLPWVVWPCL